MISSSNNHIATNIIEFCRSNSSINRSPRTIETITNDQKSLRANDPRKTRHALPQIRFTNPPSNTNNQAINPLHKTKHRIISISTRIMQSPNQPRRISAVRFQNPSHQSLSTNSPSPNRPRTKIRTIFN